MVIWRTGKSWQWKAEAEQLALIREGVDFHKEYKTIDGVGVFFDETDEPAPPIFAYWLRAFEARHEITIFAHLRQTYHPTVSDQDRFHVSPIPDIPRTFRVLVRYGYSEPQSAITAASAVMNAVAAYLDIQRSNSASGTAAHIKAAEDAQVLAHANQKKAPIYLFGRKDIQLKEGTRNPFKLAVVWVFIMMREVLTAKPKLWELPTDQIVEIGKALPIGGK
ncbi:MAG: hypothetical protein CYPHOPRED_005583 [Cyphobasidiales sp. Tagirdzhanova-0007]|nr:MAG: hypothetical protein CYPHOPRED_005583 [Cyphobasidiales sp. Tagirdzhanova-0007]